jgi:glyoxalase-like protein
MLRLDHVIFATPDLDATAEDWRRRLGLDSVEGGRHERWGTANRIVPLGDDYVELVAVLDPDEGRANAFGRAVLERGQGWLGPVVATDDLDAIAARLGLEISSGSRRRPDGQTLRWRSAGFDDPRRAWWMPFFIAWDVPPERHPGRERAGHGIQVRGIASVSLIGDRERLRSWLGDDDTLPFEIAHGDDAGAIDGVKIATAGGILEIV